VIADLRLKLPSSNTELFELLAGNKIISAKLSKHLTSMAGFRNILVHEYLEIDRRKVFVVLSGNLGDFEKFIRAISKLLSFGDSKALNVF
jgi:uncharacterized protein YutE (UPF0331/DUF86 family)